MFLNLDGIHINSDQCICDPDVEMIFANDGHFRTILFHNKIPDLEITDKQQYEKLKSDLMDLDNELIFIDIDLKFEREMLRAMV